VLSNAESDKAKRIRRRPSKRFGRCVTHALAEFVAGQSLVEDRPVYKTGAFPFLTPIEENWMKIRAELDRLLPHREHLPAFHQISRDQTRISRGDHWKVFILFGFGMPIERNCALCPETTRLLRMVPGLQSAWFSILAPRYHIPRHHGVTKTILRAHLGLKTPTLRDQCRMRVDDQTVTWEPGRLVVFDDFYSHEVWNDTDEKRVVLIFDFNRPMRPLGRLLNSVLIWALKRTAYFKDAARNLKNWDERLETAVMTADTMFDEAVPEQAATAQKVASGEPDDSRAHAQSRRRPD
jgi:aspartyl/asparaginyl beta-hydroxylase (cupin superfamily)